MGSFNLSCSITSKQIEVNDDCVIMLGAGFSLPFFGKYADYGQFELNQDVKNIYAINHLIEMVFNYELFLEKQSLKDLKIFYQKISLLTTFLEEDFNESDEEDQKKLMEDLNHILSFLDLSIISAKKSHESYDVIKLLNFIQSFIELKMDFEQNLKFNLDLNLQDLLKKFTQKDFEKISNCLRKMFEFFEAIKDSHFVGHKIFYWFNHLQPQVILKMTYDNIIAYQSAEYKITDFENQDELFKYSEQYYDWSYPVLGSLSDIYFKIDMISDYSESKAQFAPNLEPFKMAKMAETYRSLFYQSFFNDNHLTTKFNGFLRKYFFKDNFTQDDLIDVLNNLRKKDYWGEKNINLSYSTCFEKDRVADFYADENFISLKNMLENNFLIQYYMFISNVDRFCIQINPYTPSGQDVLKFNQFYQYLYSKTYF